MKTSQARMPACISATLTKHQKQDQRADHLSQAGVRKPSQHLQNPCPVQGKRHSVDKRIADEVEVGLRIYVPRQRHQPSKAPASSSGARESRILPRETARAKPHTASLGCKIVRSCSQAQGTQPVALSEQGTLAPAGFPAGQP